MCYKNKYQHLISYLIVSILSRNFISPWPNDFFWRKNRRIINIRIYGNGFLSGLIGYTFVRSFIDHSIRLSNVIQSNVFGVTKRYICVKDMCMIIMIVIMISKGISSSLKMSHLTCLLIKLIRLKCVFPPFSLPCNTVSALFKTDIPKHGSSSSFLWLTPSYIPAELRERNHEH